MTIQQMREKRAELARQLRNIHENNKHDWKPEHQAEYDRLATEIGNLDGAIRREEEVLNIAAAERSNLDRMAAENGMSRDEAEETERTVFNAWLRGGDRALTKNQLDFIAKRIANTMSTTVPGEGGVTVATEVATTLIEALKEFGGMREVATVIATANGAPMNFPTTNATAEEGEIIGENAAATDADPSFNTKAIGAFKYSSKVVTAPIELLQDSSVNLEAHIVGRIAQRIARIQNKHFTVGTGVGQPEGIVTASVAGKTGANGQTTTVIWDDLYDLEHAVDPAYRKRPGCGYMFADSTLKALKKIKDSQNRPLWLPGVAVKEPDTINGYRYIINQDMPAMAASAKSILFGDLSAYTIRDSMQITFYRFTDSAFAKKGQVGFLAFARADGKLLDVGGAVKHYANSAV
jgi:HK97 family phage major capsid protein